MVNASSWQSTFPIYYKPFGAGNLLLSSLGVVGNASVLLAISRTRELRLQVCTYLMGALAIADLFTCLMFMQFSIMTLVDCTFITNLTCFRLLLPGLFAMNVESLMVWVVGVDRALLLLLPASYTMWNRNIYMCALILPALIYGLVVVIIGLRAADQSVVPVCIPPTAYRATGQAVWVFSAVLISLLVILTYIVAYCTALRKGYGGRSQSDSDAKRRLLSSLALVGAVYACSWMLTMVSVMAATTLPIITDFWSFHISLYVGYLADINACSNPVIYCLRSTDWRRAILGSVWRISRFRSHARHPTTGGRLSYPSVHANSFVRRAHTSVIDATQPQRGRRMFTSTVTRPTGNLLTIPQTMAYTKRSFRANCPDRTLCEIESVSFSVPPLIRSAREPLMETTKL